MAWYGDDATSKIQQEQNRDEGMNTNLIKEIADTTIKYSQEHLTREKDKALITQAMEHIKRSTTNTSTSDAEKKSETNEEEAFTYSLLCLKSLNILIGIIKNSIHCPSSLTIRILQEAITQLENSIEAVSYEYEDEGSQNKKKYKYLREVYYATSNLELPA